MLLIAAGVSLLCGCARTASGVKLPGETQVKEVIAGIIEDKTDAPVKISETDDEIVWEVGLPEKNGIKVKFNCYKVNPSFSIDGSSAFDYWEMNITTDYVRQCVYSADKSLLYSIDEKYNITPGSEEYDEHEKYNSLHVKVHTPMSLDEFTAEKMVAYLHECLDAYGLKLVTMENLGDCRKMGVESMIYYFTLDNVPDTTGGPLTLSIQLNPSTLSPCKENDYSGSINENWAYQQISGQKIRYESRLNKSNE